MKEAYKTKGITQACLMTSGILTKEEAENIFVMDVSYIRAQGKETQKELHVPAAIAPEIELLELYEQWNDYNEYVIDKFIRFDAVYYIPLHDTTIPSIIKQRCSACSPNVRKLLRLMYLILTQQR